MGKVSKSSNFSKGFKANFLYSPKQESGFQKLLSHLNVGKERKKGKMESIRRSYDSRNHRGDTVSNSFDTG